MTQSVVGALRVTLGLDSAQFSKGAKKAESTVQRLGGQLQKFGAAMSLVSAGIVAALRSQLNAADNAAKAAQRVGLSVEALTRLRFAADLAGASSEQLETGIQRLSRSMQDGNKAFARLGVSARDVAGNLRPTEDVLLDLADVFADMPDGAAKTAAAMELLGRSGANLIPLLNGGSAALRGMMAEADALGVTISTETAQAAERFNDALTRIGASVTGIARQITAELAPVMANIAETVQEAVAAFGALSPEVRTAAAVAVTLTAALGPLALAIGTVLKSLALLKVAMIALSGPIGITVGLVTAAAAGFLLMRDGSKALPKPIDEAKVAMSLLNEALGDFSSAAPGITAEKIAVAEANLQIATTALQAAEAELALLEAKQGVARALFAENRLTADGSSGYETEMEKRATAERALIDSMRLSLSDATARIMEMEIQLGKTTGATKKLGTAVKSTGGAIKSTGEEIKRSFSPELLAAIAKRVTEIGAAAEAFAPLETAVGSVADAFGNFVANGLTDFKSFTQSIIGSFRSMLATMISDAIKNKIAISIGTAATGAAGSAIAGVAGGVAGGAAGGGLGLAGIAAALGPVGIIAGGIAAIGGLLFGRSRRRRRRRAERRAREEAEEQAEAQERGGLEIELLRTQGDTAALRQKELDALRPANRELAERIFQLQDEQRVGEERSALEQSLLELQGNTAELRRRELEALDPSNRALAKRIFRLRDEQERQADLAATQQQRLGLEDRLLRLQGDTAELRRREVAALDPANRGLLNQIFALEDYQDALETSKGALERLTNSLAGAFDLDSIEYGSSFEQRLAQVAEARGVDSIAGVAARNLLPAGDPQIELLRKQLMTLDSIVNYGIPSRA